MGKNNTFATKFNPKSCKIGENQMCGIIGYNGQSEAKDKILSGLYSLEYRGYDSAGVAGIENGSIKVIKSKDKIEKLDKKLQNQSLGTIAIGHTRWATHGQANETNAHPHHSDDFQVALVHNGIIENYAELKEKLKKNGYTFYSETDTEILTKLVHYYYKKYGTPLNALARVTLRATGTFAAAILFASEPENIYCIRRGSPLMVGKGPNGNYIASDQAALEHTCTQVAYLDDHELVRVKKHDIEFFTIDQEPINKTYEPIQICDKTEGKNGYSHYMLKEIYEQPKVFSKVLSAYTKNNQVSMPTLDNLGDVERIYIVACGSAYHAGLAAKDVFVNVAKIPTSVHLASEFRYNQPIMSRAALAVFVSQSGETADTLAAMRNAKQKGIRTLSIVNCVPSSLSRESEYFLSTLAGREIAVATTKAYLAQVLTMQLFAIKLAKNRGFLTNQTQKSYILKLSKIPTQIKKILQNPTKIKNLASKIYTKYDVFFMGRGLDYALAQEGSLKLKEISYTHSEAYAAGELKHGTISLIEKGTLVVGIITQPHIAEKTISNLVEVVSRGADVVLFSSCKNLPTKTVAKKLVSIPKTDPMFAPLITVVPLQLLAYNIALFRGLNIDKPRNLAKSVTVE